MKLFGNEPKDMQSVLDAINECSTKNKMSINIEKCTVIHFGKNNLLIDYFINNTKVPCKDFERDLGIVIDSNLSFDMHLSKIKQRTYYLIKNMHKIFRTKDKI